jgi:phospholipase/lecithinase/hemolysin
VACCGGGGSDGVPNTGGCGHGEYHVCADPEKYGSWDDTHPTEVVYKVIADGLLRGSYTQPPIAITTNSCPQLTSVISSVGNKTLPDL